MTSKFKTTELTGESVLYDIAVTLVFFFEGKKKMWFL